MAEVPLPTPTDNAVPSTDIRDAVYAGAMLDKVVTSTELKYTDRLGGEHYTVDGIKAEGDKVVEETRQNLIPLSRQYMTLEAAQADIANIPSGSATYVRSTDGSSLADEYINNAGTLQPTGRKMPSQEAINAVFDFISKFIVSGDVGNNFFPFFTDGDDNVPLWWDDGFAVSRISSALYQMIYDDVHSRLGNALNSSVNDVTNSFFPLFIDASNNVPVWWDNGFDVSIISESLKAKIWDYINSIISPALNKAVPLVSAGFVPGMTDGADNVLFWFQDGKFDTYEVGPNISASLASAYQRRMYTAYYNMPLHTDGRTLWRWRAKKAQLKAGMATQPNFLLTGIAGPRTMNWRQL